MGKLGGIILCGGRSRRMGRPKAWLQIGPELLLHRVARRLGEAVGPIVVVAAPGQDVPGLPDAVRVVRDPVAGRGPLQGLAAGLAALPPDVTLAYATATDAPFLEPAWVARLAELIGSHDLAVPESGGHLHPLAALYRREPVLPAAEALIDAGRLRLTLLLELLDGLVVAEDSMTPVDPGLATLRNLNDPGDYRQALRDAGFEPPPG